MMTLRFIGGILLAAVGIDFLLGSIFLIFARDPEVPLWAALVMLVGFGLAPLAGAILLLKTPEVRQTPALCPKCGGTEHAPAGVLTRAHNPWLFHFGGWMFATLWGASRERQVRCISCDALYFTQTKGSRVSRILLLIVIVIMVMNAVISYYFPQR